MRATERNRDPGAELRELKSLVDLTGRKSQTAKKNGAEPFGQVQENEEAHSCFSYTAGNRNWTAHRRQNETECRREKRAACVQSCRSSFFLVVCFVLL
jgi:hypothetical protein